MKSHLCAISIAILLMSAQAALAFNGERQGFVLGFGGGGGVTRFSGPGGCESESAIGTTVKIGYATSDQTMVYWMSRVAWLPDALDSDLTVSHGTGGLGVTYYTRPTAPSPFIVGSIGFGNMDLPFEDVPAETSFGIAAGGGFELTRHVALEGVLTWTKILEDLNLVSILFVVDLTA